MVSDLCAPTLTGGFTFLSSPIAHRTRNRTLTDEGFRGYCSVWFRLGFICLCSFLLVGFEVIFSVDKIGYDFFFFSQKHK